MRNNKKIKIQNIQIRHNERMLEIIDKTLPKVGLSSMIFLEQLLQDVIESQMYFMTFKLFLKTYFLILILYSQEEILKFFITV